jgi:hypothetical protein
MGERKGIYRVFVGNPEGRGHWGDPGIDKWLYNIVYHNFFLLFIIFVYHVYQTTCFGSCDDTSSGLC